MSEENKAVVRRYIEEILNRSNPAPLEEIFTGDSIFHAPGMPELRGLEGRKQLVMAIHNAFPDIRYTIEAMIAEDDKVAVSWTAVGSHKGEWLGIAPAGKQLANSGVCIFRLAGGKIADELAQFDSLSTMRQLSGTAPAPKATRKPKRKRKPKPKSKPKPKAKSKAKVRAKAKPRRKTRSRAR
jgi:steroid delta-isomerase-like uncharacterized protein